MLLRDFCFSSLTSSSGMGRGITEVVSRLEATRSIAGRLRRLVRYLSYEPRDLRAQYDIVNNPRRIWRGDGAVELPGTMPPAQR